MEAMAWGKPVISTRHAGIPELVGNILIEENNTDELMKAIEYLADNKHLWREMGDDNTKIISKSYSSANVNILSDIFNAVA